MHTARRHGGQEVGALAGAAVAPAGARQPAGLRWVRWLTRQLEVCGMGVQGGRVAVSRVGSGPGITEPDWSGLTLEETVAEGALVIGLLSRQGWLKGIHQQQHVAAAASAHSVHVMASQCSAAVLCVAAPEACQVSLACGTCAACWPGKEEDSGRSCF